MNEDMKTISRKIQIIPVAPISKQGVKKVFEKAKEDLETEIKNVKKDKEMEKADKDNKIKQITEDFEKAFNSGVPTKKMAMNYTYSLLRKSMEYEAEMKNYLLSAMFSEVVLSKKDIKEARKDLKELWNSAFRTKGSPKGSLYDDTDIETFLGGYGFDWNQQVSSKFWDSMKKGLSYGKVSLPNYKSDSPLTVAKTHIGFAYDYETPEECVEHYMDADWKVCFCFGSCQKETLDTITRFEVKFGKPYKSRELRTTIARVITGEYKYCGSSVQISKQKIILNLSIQIPKKQIELDENTVVGVDLGIAIPAVCALNNDYKRKFIGSAKDFLRVRTKIRSERKRLQSGLKATNGGHGKKKKLSPLERFSSYERNWVKTYNHNVSKNVVDFAIKNNAKYINIENLEGFDSSKFILSNWSYYELQEQITYKASKYGIEVRKINPCYTSQVCSCCGKWTEGNRETQYKFICKNPECKQFEKEVNADFNASRNISKSTLFIDKKPKNMKKETWEEKKKEMAREYYGIEINQD